MSKLDFPLRLGIPKIQGYSITFTPTFTETPAKGGLGLRRAQNRTIPVQFQATYMWNEDQFIIFTAFYNGKEHLNGGMHSFNLRLSTDGGIHVVEDVRIRKSPVKTSLLKEGYADKTHNAHHTGLYKVVLSLETLNHRTFGSDEYDFLIDWDASFRQFYYNVIEVHDMINKTKDFIEQPIFNKGGS